MKGKTGGEKDREMSRQRGIKKAARERRNMLHYFRHF